jgi:hypothetical protein
MEMPVVTYFLKEIKTKAEREKEKNEQNSPDNLRLYIYGEIPHLQSVITNIKTSLWPPLLICSCTRSFIYQFNELNFRRIHVLN